MAHVLCLAVHVGRRYEDTKRSTDEITYMYLRAQVEKLMQTLGHPSRHSNHRLTAEAFVWVLSILDSGQRRMQAVEVFS